jgi:hypothetical protein
MVATLAPSAGRGTALAAQTEIPGAVTGITDLSDAGGGIHAPVLTLKLGGDLFVGLNGTEPLYPANWVLNLNGQALPDLSRTAETLSGRRGILFHLNRAESDKAAWAALLGSPATARAISVTMLRTDIKEASQVGAVDAANPATFQLNVLGTWWLAAAIFIAGFVLFALGYTAARSSVLRDGILPQIPQTERPFSLGRCQMAFWFTLVILSFLFLWALLWDSDTVTPQALALMGISAATAGGALAANSTNNKAANDAGKALTAAGFVGPSDIIAVRESLGGKQARRDELKQRGLQVDPALDADIDALRKRKEIYDEQTQEYISATCDPGCRGRTYVVNLFSDLVVSRDGLALHRLQVVVWTMVLGVVFLVGVYREMAMPAFSATLLALIGVSGASYVGFKFPEAI